MQSSTDREQLTHTIALVLSWGLAFIGLSTTALQFAIGGGGKLYTALGGAAGLIGLMLVRTGRSREAIVFLAVLLGAIVTVADVMIDSPIDRGAAFLLLPTLTIAVGFVMGERAAIWFCSYTVVLMGVSAYDESLVSGRGTGPIVRGVLDGSLLAFAGWLTVAIVRDREGRTEDLGRALDEMQGVIIVAQQVASGDLSRLVEGQDQLSTAIRAMQDRLRALVSEVNEGTEVLAPSGTEIAASARQNEQLARQQAAAIQEIRVSVESMADMAADISGTAQLVGANAERSRETVGEVNRTFERMTSQYRRIEDLLSGIGDIARKSEILALNAALEGHRAGEAGHGFALVAVEMRKLSEDTRSAARAVGSLVGDVSETSTIAADAVRSLHQVAGDSDNLSRRISQATLSQRHATEQLVHTIAELERSGTDLARGAEQTIDLAEHLVGLSGKLEGSVAGYRV